MKKRQQQQWKDLPARRRRGIAMGGLIEMVLTGVALWDLSHRPAGQVKGKKGIWAVVCFIQPLGPISYLLFGRKR